MKKILTVIKKIFLSIIVVVMAVFFTLLSVILTPFRLIRYRKSHFAVDSGADYAPGITDSPVYRLYNALRQENIPIGLVLNPKAPADAHLLWKDTLIIHEIDRVAFREGRWVIAPGSPVWKEGLDLQEAIAEVLDDVFDDRPGIAITDAVLLLDRRSAPREAEDSGLFLLYGSREEQAQALRQFCKTH